MLSIFVYTFKLVLYFVSRAHSYLTTEGDRELLPLTNWESKSLLPSLVLIVTCFEIYVYATDLWDNGKPKSDDF